MSEALGAGSEELDLASPSSKARLYALVESQARAEAAAPAPDSPAIFAVEVDSQLLAAALPTAEALVAGAGAPVDVEASADPWPADRRTSLSGMSEREAAQAAASATGRPKPS